MDSGDSGSLQSSSGAEEECDSRATDSISAFINNNPTTHLHPISNPPQPPPFSATTTTMFDPLSNYFTDQTLLSRSNHHQHSLLNLDSIIWSNKTLASDQTINHINPFTEFQPLNFTISSNSVTTSSLISREREANDPFPPADKNLATTTAPLTSSDTSPTTSPPVRNTKKRSRASRRAPTTVLTTDTTNFRAMVQEFTGIPAPPFTSISSSPFNRSRLDLFGAPSSIRSNPPPPYLLRPFPQKLQPPSSFNNNMQTTVGNNLTFQSNNFLNNNNQSMGLGPISSFLGPKSQDGNGMKVGDLDEFGLVNNIVSSVQTSRTDNVNPVPSNWGGSGGGRRVATSTTTSLSNNF